MSGVWRIDKKKDIDRCKDCKYFIQHYTKNRYGYSKCSAGHCTYPRIKDRLNETKACKNFERGKYEDE